MVLYPKKACKDDDRQRNDVGFKKRGDDPDTLDRAEHGYGRGDHAVSVKQASGKQPQSYEDRRGCPGHRISPSKQRRERYNAAFSMIVCSKYEGEVLERHDNCQGPKYERKNSKDVRFGYGDAIVTVEALPDGV